MAARKTTRPRRAGKPKRTIRAGKQVRFTAGSSLSRAESQRLEANAAADLRSVSNYVSRLVVEDLRRDRKTRRRAAAVVKSGERRVTYEVAVQITAGEKKKLQARARAEMRSVSNYVAKLVIEDLHRR